MSEICRTCLLSNGKLESLFEWKLVGNQVLTFSKIISLCTGLEISKFDDFSNFICELCSASLIKAFEYRRKCWESHRTLLKRCRNDRKNINRIETNDSFETVSLDLQNNGRDEYIIEVNDTLNSSENSPIVIEDNVDLSAVSLEDKVLDDDYEIVPMKDFLLYVEYKIDKTRHFGRIFICRLCSQAYENQHYMVNHFKIAHKTIFKLENEFKCNICSKVYGQKSGYQRHVRWHKNQTSYVCTYCGVTLKCKFTLTEHVRVHTGEKPYKCDYCDFRSGKRSVITIHLRTHTGERPFLCHICNKRCPTTAARATHMKTHSTEFKYECPICNKKFRTPGVLSTHKLIHDSSKHRECNVCGKQFSRLNQLKNHIRVHTRDYCHKCSECGRGFIQRHCWRTHMKNHHNQIVS